MPDRLPLSDPSFREDGAIRIRAEREPGAVLAAALNLITSEARTLFTAVFAIAGPMVVLAALARIVGGATVGAVVGSVLDMWASVMSSAAVFGFVRLYASGQTREVGDVWDEAKTLIGPIFTYILVIVLGLIALLIPVGLVGAALAGMSVPVLAVAGTVLAVGVLLYVVPPLSLGVVAVALDGMGVGAALSHVQALIQGRRKQVVLTMLLMAAIAVFALVILSGVLGALVVSGVASGDPTGGPAVALSSAMLTLVALPVGVLSSLVWVFLYGSLVEVVEGASLGSDLERLAGTDLLGVGRRPEAPRAVEARDEAQRGAARRDEAPPESFRPAADTLPSDELDARDDDATTNDATTNDAPPSGFRGGGFQNP